MEKIKNLKFKIKNSIKVIVAMSGGVDSSVAAAILKKQGFDVAGVFMHFWSEKPKNKLGYEAQNRCCSIEAQELARRVAQKINTPFYTLNFDADFKKYVVNTFISEYKRGVTPNPCVACNKFIKFDFLLKKARALDAEYLATGHYVRLWRKIRNSKFEIRNKFKIQNSKLKIKIFKARDQHKDQSYFLYNLTNNQLSHLIFPIGDYTKPQVRALAKKLGLPTAARPDSQEVCFILEKDYFGFLKRHIKNIKSGKIVNQNGKEIGEHQGLPFYTIGQRKNIGLSSGPYYVFKKDQKKNILYVTNNPKDPQLFFKNIVVADVNFIAGVPPKLPFSCYVKIRYQHAGGDAKIVKKISKNLYQIQFSQPVRAVTAGQSAVFYHGKELIGGGVISS